MYQKLRPLLFRRDPESAHDDALRLLHTLTPFTPLLRLLFDAPAAPVRVFGLDFPNPVGLAAGYDKDAVATPALAALGFGHLEIGTVTPLPQEGNPRPRVFRIPEAGALINRMGFPSQGANAVLRSLKRRRYCQDNRLQRSGIISLKNAFTHLLPRKAKKKDFILGVNIGKNKTTPNKDAVLDYLSLLELFAPCADYLAVNVSSPNTPGLRALQQRAALEALLKELDYQRRLEEKKLHKKLPLLVKLSPDLSTDELARALEAILAANMDGVILTNTTKSRAGLPDSAVSAESGGMSGLPLKAASESALASAVKLLDGALPIVSVGGIHTPEDAKKRLEMGASLVQIYTGLIYEGPGLVKRILRAVAEQTPPAWQPYAAPSEE